MQCGVTQNAQCRALCLARGWHSIWVGGGKLAGSAEVAESSHSSERPKPGKTTTHRSGEMGPLRAGNCSHRVFPQDFQDPTITGQKRKANLSHPQWIQMKTVTGPADGLVVRSAGTHTADTGFGSQIRRLEIRASAGACAPLLWTRETWRKQRAAFLLSLSAEHIYPLAK